MTSPKRSTERARAGGSLLWALFSFAGRMKRLDFLLASLALAIGHVVLVILALAVTRSGMNDSSGYAVRGIIDLALFWPSAAIAAKRGHDRNRPAARSVRIDLAPFTDRVVIDGTAYWHGQTVTVAASVAAVLREQCYRTWQHQDHVEGKNTVEAYRRQRNAVISAKHGIIST